MEPLFSTRAQPVTISRLTQQIKGVLEEQVSCAWVVGEVSNFKRAGSGHWYFSLKDDKSQIRCTMWRGATNRVSFQPKDGMELLIFGNLNVYAPRGEYSLVVERMEEVGLGRLKMAFEQLKARLGEEGLFEAKFKKPLPFFPRKIGLVTSPTGAAVRDIFRVLLHRFPGVHVLLFPARVQGQGAAEEIAKGIQWLDERESCDVLIVGRGGGSEEDLWCFNEEVLARAIFKAKTPIISAVGHEVDFTISDFVADVRAATPSNGAELVIKSRSEYLQIVDGLRKHMDRSVQRKILLLKNRVNVSESHPIFIRIRSRVNDLQRRLADLDQISRRKLEQRLKTLELRLLRAGEALKPNRLVSRASFLEQRLKQASDQLNTLVQQQLQGNLQNLATLTGRLEDLSPLKILNRGYAAVFDEKNRVVRGPDDVKYGEIIHVRLADGELDARVVEKEEAVQTELF